MVSSDIMFVGYNLKLATVVGSGRARVGCLIDGSQCVEI